jgi:hypothetical protein
MSRTDASRKRESSGRSLDTSDGQGGLSLLFSRDSRFLYIYVSDKTVINHRFSCICNVQYLLSLLGS